MSAPSMPPPIRAPRTLHLDFCAPAPGTLARRPGPRDRADPPAARHRRDDLPERDPNLRLRPDRQRAGADHHPQRLEHPGPHGDRRIPRLPPADLGFTGQRTSRSARRSPISRASRWSASSGSTPGPRSDTEHPRRPDQRPDGRRPTGCCSWSITQRGSTPTSTRSA